MSKATRGQVTCGDLDHPEYNTTTRKGYLYHVYYMYNIVRIKN